MDKLDILNRDDFVNRLIELINTIASKKQSVCFALNGSWGCGKSFVLDLMEERLKTNQDQNDADNQFFVVRYNCWKYDYYEEPLIAIVANLISSIEKETKLFPDSKEKQEVLGMLKTTGLSLLKLINSAVKNKSGMDILSSFETVSKGLSQGDKEYKAMHDYDIYFGFNQIIQRLKEDIQNLSKEQTIVLVVDELDRCLPEYAIKVLERLHHLTEESENIITIVSVDKERLLQSVEHLFGYNEAEKYLEKFIRFEVKLDYGKVSERVSEKYKDYFELFNKELFEFSDSVEEFIQAIFMGIDIRTQEQLIDRAMLAHKLLFDTPKDYMFMCTELLLAVMICIYKNNLEIPVIINDHDSSSAFVQPYAEKNPPFIDFFKDKYTKIFLAPVINYSVEKTQRELGESLNLYGAVLYYWYKVHSQDENYLLICKNKAVVKNTEDICKFVKTLKLIS